MRRFDGQTAIVTGGARGIGLGIAQRLMQEGCRVAVWDIDPVAHAAGCKPALVQRVDIADLGAVERAFAAALEALGGVDILVNNAGVNGPVLPAWEYPPEEWARVLAIDLTGVFHCCRVAVPHMRGRRYGRIVNIASIAGKEGMPGISAYSAAKAGVIGFTKAIARELAESGVTVNAIAPVIVETALFREMTPEHIEGAEARIPMGRFLTVPEVAALAAWIASRESSFTTGAVFDISGGRATY
jgi:NAD(P)-dependent dehydrogenase (short-subunit alcohol dehydrogenase family)